MLLPFRFTCFFYGKNRPINITLAFHSIKQGGGIYHGKLTLSISLLDPVYSRMLVYLLKDSI